MQILVAELQPNQMGAFYLMSLGVDMPDAVTKTDLTSIITFLCKKLCWIEEEENISPTIDTKSREKNNENTSTNSIPLANGDGENEIPDMDWIEDTLSDQISENSAKEGSVVDTLPQALRNGAGIVITNTAENGNQKENTCNDKILNLKNEFDPENGCNEEPEIPDQTTPEKPGSNEGAQPAKTFKCTYCDKGFEDAFGLKRHTRSHRETFDGSGSLCCPKCGKYFTSSDGLNQHIMRVHTNPNYKPHKCSHCGKGFREPSKVRVHEMIHTGEKPISCTKCEYRCSTMSALRAHERAHIGDKPHSCSRCEKKFATKDTLKNHELIHDNAQAFSCDLCDKTFNYNSNLRKHKRGHHKADSEK